MKNIDRPIRVWRWHPDQAPEIPGSPVPAESRRRLPAIAVLPFDNMSGDAGQDYFSDGMTEDIITDLSKIGGLMVIARNSSFAYKGRRVDIRTVGRELGIDTVVEGSIRRVGNRVRITAQLIDATTGGHLWAERYDREMTDIFEVQDDVTRCIVEALKVTLSPDEQTRLTETGTASPEAHDHFLRARVILSNFVTREGYAEARAGLERAIALDPGYAYAYGALALANVIAYNNGWVADREAALRGATRLAGRALGLAPEDANVNYSVAVVAGVAKDFPRCRNAVDKALALSPSHPGALSTRGILLTLTGHPADGIPDIERAMRLDPGNDHHNLQFLGIAHLLLGNHETARAVIRQRINLAPKTDSGRAILTAVLGYLGETDESRRVWQEMLDINPRYSLTEHLNRLFNRPEDIALVTDGLARAGLPREV